MLKTEINSRPALIGNSMLNPDTLRMRKAERKRKTKPSSFFKACEKEIKRARGYKNHLKTLPPEILSIVLGFLELADQGALAATSIHFFLEVTKETNELYEHLKEKHMENIARRSLMIQGFSGDISQSCNYKIHMNNLDNDSLASQLSLRQLRLLPEYLDAKNQLFDNLRYKTSAQEMASNCFSFSLYGLFFGYVLDFDWIMPLTAAIFLMAGAFMLRYVQLNIRLKHTEQLTNQIKPWALVNLPEDRAEARLNDFDDETDALSIGQP